MIQDLQLPAPSVKVTFLHMDLADLDTIAIAADMFLAENKRLDILIANAGIMAMGPETSKIGFEIQFATNFLGHALLISKLLTILLSTSAEYGDARIVSVTSTGFHVAAKDQGIIFDDLTTTQNYGFGSNWTRYGQSKLALLYLINRHYFTSQLKKVHSLSHKISRFFVDAWRLRFHSLSFQQHDLVSVHPWSV